MKVQMFYCGDLNGIAQNVQRLYIGVDGVAKLIWQRPVVGVTWKKLDCYESPYTEAEWQKVDSGTITCANDEYYYVYTDVYYDGSGVSWDDEQEFTGDWLDGYWLPKDEDYSAGLFLSNPQPNEDETETTYDYDEYTLVELSTEWVWETLGVVGTVIAPEGELPDADKGYTYHGEFEYNGKTYIRMRDQNGGLYAYIKEV